MKKTLLFLLVIVSVCYCNFFSKKVSYKGKTYTIEDSEFGVAFISEYNGIEYYIHDTVYQTTEEGFYCKIAGSQDEGDRWVILKGETAKNIDSASIDFKSCKALSKNELLE